MHLHLCPIITKIVKFLRTHHYGSIALKSTNTVRILMAIMIATATFQVKTAKLQCRNNWDVTVMTH